MSASPILDQQRFLFSDTSINTRLRDLAGGYVLGSSTDTADFPSALLILQPEWLNDEEVQAINALGAYNFITEADFGSLDLPDVLDIPEGAGLGFEGTSISAAADGQSLVMALGLVEPNRTTPSHSLLFGISLPEQQDSSNSILLLQNQPVTQLVHPDPEDWSETELLTLEWLSSTDSVQVTRWPEFAGSDSPDLTNHDLAAGTSDAAPEELALLSAATEPAGYVQLTSLFEQTESGLNPAGGRDILVSRWDDQGTLLWEELFGNSGGEYSPQVAVDDLGVVVGATLTGSFSSYNPAASNADIGIGLARYDLDGQLLWQRRLGDLSLDSSQALSDLLITDDGTILVLGSTLNQDPDLGFNGQSAAGAGDQVADVDAFLTAYTSDGDRLWSHQFGSQVDDQPLGFDLLSLPKDNESVETLVVFGYQDPLDASLNEQAWIELMELPDSTQAIDSAYLPPPAPEFNFAVIDDRDKDNLVIDLQGVSAPGVDLTIQLSSDNSEQSRIITSDVVTGQWRYQAPVDSSLEQQLSSDFPTLVAVGAIDPITGLESDVVLEQIVQSGNGLSPDRPEILWIDPDSTGPEAAVPLQRFITRPSSGPLTYSSARLLVDYTGTLLDGTQFDSSVNPKPPRSPKPFELEVDVSNVISGWHEGLRGVPVGSQVKLVIPPELAYQGTFAITGDLKDELAQANPNLLNPYSYTVSAHDLAHANQIEEDLVAWLFKPNTTSVEFIPAGSRDIPSYSALNFIVDLRADLSVAESFYKNLAYSAIPSGESSTLYELLNGLAANLLGDPSSDIIDLAHEIGFLGTSSADNILIPQRLKPSLLPLMAMGGIGNDTLAGTLVEDEEDDAGQALILFGESGNDDLIASAEAHAAFLDGGDGDDQFRTQAHYSMILGGPGLDTLYLDHDEWELLQWNFVDESQPLIAIGAVESDPDSIVPYSQTIYLSGVEALNHPDDISISFNSVPSGRMYALAAQKMIELQDLKVGSYGYDFSTLPTLFGRVDELNELFDLNYEDLGLGSQDIIVTGEAISVADALDLHRLTTGSLQASIVETDWESISQLMSVGLNNNHQFTFEVTDSTLNLDQYVKFIPVIQTANLVGVQSFEGSQTSLETVFDHAQTILPSGSPSQNLAFSTPLSLAEFLDWTERTTGAITASISSSLLEVDELIDSTEVDYELLDNTELILDDLSYSAADLLDLVNQTSALILLTSSGQAPQIEGSLADILDLYARSNISSSLSEADVLISDSTPVLAQDLLDLSELTTGIVDAFETSSMIGDARTRNEVVYSDTISSSFVDDIAPEILSIDLPGGVFRAGESLSIQLNFSEPVFVQDDVAVPWLELSDGLRANWQESNHTGQSHTFQLDLAEVSKSVENLEVLSVFNPSDFFDLAGNELSDPIHSDLNSSSNPTRISSEDWTLDVDNNGSITALGDGLMIIRYLFGSAFSGDALTDNAADFNTPGSRQSSGEIRDYISEAYSSGLLDVDRDNSTQALTDGLLIIRDLFGAAFSGHALIENALGSNSELLNELDVGDINNLSNADKLEMSMMVRSNISELR